MQMLDWYWRKGRVKDGQSWGKVVASGRTSPIGRGDLGRNSNLINPSSVSLSLPPIFPADILVLSFLLLLATCSFCSCSRVDSKSSHTKHVVSISGDRGVPLLRTLCVAAVH